MNGGRVDGIFLVGVALVFLVGLSLIVDGTTDVEAAEPVIQHETPLTNVGGRAPPPLSVTGKQEVVVAPYDSYILTQGPHGYSYGHMAIDIVAGQGVTIKSPINGEVTALYVDEYGNTTLNIENDIYQTTMLHGDYTVAVGDVLRLGQPVGSESNHGYTLDMQGNSCYLRDCGYHTHLNIYDKRLGQNVNPLEVLDGQG